MNVFIPPSELRFANFAPLSSLSCCTCWWAIMYLLHLSSTDVHSRGEWVGLCLHFALASLKLRGRLVSVHHLISSWYKLWSLFVMRPTMTAIIVHQLHSRVHLMSGCVVSVNGGGLSTQPWGAPILTTNIEQVWLPIQTVWSPISCCRVLSLPQRVEFSLSASWVRLCWTLSWSQQMSQHHCYSNHFPFQVVANLCTHKH